MYVSGRGGHVGVSFLDLANKTYVVFGVANRRSVAYHIADLLEDEGATVVYSVQNDDRRDAVAKLLPGREVYVCDVEHDEPIHALAEQVRAKHPTVHGLVHSIAFADYESYSGQFHEVRRDKFLQCISISCFSLTAIVNAFKDLLDRQASVVTISISTTRMAVEAYGYMAPAKAALDSSLAFLAKSFSSFSEVRFNAVCAGLLKTSASAGIPRYLDHYMFAEHVTLRKRALTTEEVANTAVFLLSQRSSGINAQGIVIDAGMGTNYFDADVVQHTLTGIWPAESSETANPPHDQV
ncbi:MAG: SDR family oxidoreductase [Planctomycetes bacterium]|nr:SDR family oxidoreductase [Planctomycetota bacterium]